METDGGLAATVRLLRNYDPLHDLDATKGQKGWMQLRFGQSTHGFTLASYQYRWPRKVQKPP